MGYLSIIGACRDTCFPRVIQFVIVPAVIEGIIKSPHHTLFPCASRALCPHAPLRHLTEATSCIVRLALQGHADVGSTGHASSRPVPPPGRGAQPLAPFTPSGRRVHTRRAVTRRGDYPRYRSHQPPRGRRDRPPAWPPGWAPSQPTSPCHCSLQHRYLPR